MRVSPADEALVRRAIELGRSAALTGDVPVGALVVDTSDLLTDSTELGDPAALAGSGVAAGALSGPDPVDAFGAWAGPGRVIAQAVNRREADRDPTAHAEVLALRAAAAVVGSWRLSDLTLVVSLEPCPMCAGAAVNARIGRIVFGAWNPDYGACGSVWDLARDRRLTHRPEVVSGVLADEAGAVVSQYFERARD